MSPERPAGMRYLALGDSYTIGEGVAADGRWPVVLAARLRARGIALDAPRIVATTGWTTDELAAGIDAAALQPPYDLVSLLIGVNNQYRGRSIFNFRDEFAALLARAVALAGGRADRVFVVSIPDWGVTPFAREKNHDPARIAAAIDTFNRTVEEIAAQAGVPHADVTTASRRAGAAPDLLVDDGLHPSAAQYLRWLDTIEPVAWKVLAG
ncbi:SGNH/GDSL hydrolase family protein [Dokdonella koreensis]|nr:SGNH/GDSL hydrolase family protein [Dokdonella koreensis]